MYRKEIEISFTQRIKEVEACFSGDQESVAERFQADIFKLEQHYQSELKDLSDSHIKQKHHWEERIQKALESAEEQRMMTEAAVEQERDRLSQEWTKERQELESLHNNKMEALMTENMQLQNELDDLIGKAQTKEIELSKQLNDLHNRLQESMNTRHELLVQSEDKALQTKLLLSKTVEDFKQERAELLRNSAGLEAKYKEMLSLSEQQIADRIELLSERDDLKIKIEKLEMLLKQTAVDFELKRKEQQENLSMLEKKLKDNLKSEEEKRDVLKVRIKELEMELNQCSASEEKEENEMLMEEVAGEDAPHILTEEDGAENPYDLVETALNIEIQDDEDAFTSNDLHGENESIAAYNQEQDNQIETPREGCDDQAGVCELKGSSPKRAELCHKGRKPSGNRNPYSPDHHPEDKHEAEMQREPVPSLEVFTDGENKLVVELSNKEPKPQDAPAVDCGSVSHEEKQAHHETVVVSSAPEETGDCDELSLEDAEVSCLPKISRSSLQELSSDSNREHFTAEINREKQHCAHDCVNALDEACEHRENLQALYNTAAEENVLLHEKISLLQQKTEILENLLAHNNEKLKTGQQVLEENYSLKVKMLLLMEHIKKLEIQAINITDMQIKYEDCLCENTKLKDQNGKLEKRVWYLEGRMNIIHDFQDEQISLVDEIGRLREENAKLSELFGELETEDEVLSALQLDAETSECPADLDEKVQAVTELEDCCREFEKQNGKLRRAITELQDKSQILNETTQAHR